MSRGFLFFKRRKRCSLKSLSVCGLLWPRSIGEMAFYLGRQKTVHLSTPRIARLADALFSRMWYTVGGKRVAHPQHMLDGRGIMAEMCKANNQMLTWQESPRVKRQDELCAGDRILATLRWQGTLSMLAFAVSPEGRWTFERPGVFSRDVQVRSTGSDTPVALFRPSWAVGGGRVELAGDHTLYWMPTNFGQTRWAFTNVSGEQLVRFEDNARSLETTVRVELGPSVLSVSQRILLLLLGRYLMVLKKRDNDATVAAFSPITVS
jgi:hypothetical protein